MTKAWHVETDGELRRESDGTPVVIHAESKSVAEAEARHLGYELRALGGAPPRSRLVVPPIRVTVELTDGCNRWSALVTISSDRVLALARRAVCPGHEPHVQVLGAWVLQ